jgi:hypothetical protein
LKRLHTRIGLGEIGLPDEPKPRAEPESEPVPEDALVGAVAPATQWPQHDPTRPAAEGSAVPDAAAPPASTPSLASTTPMPSVNEPTAAEASTNKSETNGDGVIESWLGELRPASTTDAPPVRSTDGDDPAEPHAIPVQLQQDPDAI